jgi:putative tryptophan/tyrosine transport system substrate-binding protein
MAMRRRDFIAVLGGAAAWPLVARGQQRAMPIVGVLNSTTLEGFRDYFAVFGRGLADSGYVEGRNVTFEYRAAEDHYDRLPGLADDLVNRRVAVIFTAANAPPALAAKAATRVVPVVFEMGADPVEIGLVSSLARPGGNITGVTILAAEVFQKRLALLHELVPAATTIACLVNLTNLAYSEAELSKLRAWASALGIDLLILDASSPSDIDRAFDTMAEQRAGALLVSPEAFFNTQRHQLVTLAARYAVPASYPGSRAVEIGGLMSYSGDYIDAFRNAGQYVGRILNGEKPGDLPIQQSTKFRLAINLKTAKALGLTFPPNLLALADQVIE